MRLAVHSHLCICIPSVYWHPIRVLIMEAYLSFYYFLILSIACSPLSKPLVAHKPAQAGDPPHQQLPVSSVVLDILLMRMDATVAGPYDNHSPDEESIRRQQRQNTKRPNRLPPCSGSSNSRNAAANEGSAENNSFWLDILLGTCAAGVKEAVGSISMHRLV